MICTLTARRLKPGAYQAFRSAWDPGDPHSETLAGWTEVYHCRDLADPDVVLSFGLFDGNAQGLRAAQEQLGRGSQVERIARHIEAVLLDGAFEVIEAPRP